MRRKFLGAADVRIGRGGDPIALELFEVAGNYLGIAIASLLNAFNPELVVIGVELPVRTYMRRRDDRANQGACIRPDPRAGQNRPRGAGPVSGVVGAAYAALHPPSRINGAKILTTTLEAQ